MRRAEWLNGEDSNNNMQESDEVPATPWLFCGGLENRDILKNQIIPDIIANVMCCIGSSVTMMVCISVLHGPTAVNKKSHDF